MAECEAHMSNIFFHFFNIICMLLLYVFISSLIYLMAPFMFYHIDYTKKKSKPYEQNCFDITILSLIFLSET